MLIRYIPHSSNPQFFFRTNCSPTKRYPTGDLTILTAVIPKLLMGILQKLPPDCSHTLRSGDAEAFLTWLILRWHAETCVYFKDIQSSGWRYCGWASEILHESKTVVSPILCRVSTILLVVFVFFSIHNIIEQRMLGCQYLCSTIFCSMILWIEKHQ